MKELSIFLTKSFEKASLDSSFASVSISSRPDLADYVCNGALILAKKNKVNPLTLAQKIVDSSEPNKNFTLSVAAPGFINIKVSKQFLLNQLPFNLKIEPIKNKVIIDYGSPNVAKGMHVGHLRSALIGQCLVNLYKFAQAEVYGDNHLGDWGTPLGIVITKIQEETNMIWSLDKIEELYVAGSILYKSDETFAKKVQNNTTLLQNNDSGLKAIWQKVLDVTINQLKQDYSKLGISFDYWKGESFFENLIPEMMQELKNKNLLVQSEGAWVVPTSPQPVLLQKTSGGFLYHTSDLACLKHRYLDFDKILYVVDKRQSFHFEQLFKAGSLVGYLNHPHQAEHIAFGTINGPDGTPFKTRDGGVLKLKDLIDLMQESAKKKLMELKNNYSLEESEEIINKVANAALKFAELKHNRSSDYIFEVDKFTALEGFTGPYILYSAVRCQSVLNNKKVAGVLDFNKEIFPVEFNLLLKLNQFSETFNASLKNHEPHILCLYLYELANVFNSLYSQQKFLNLENKTHEAHYMALVEKTFETLNTGLNLLGITVPNKM